MRALPLQKRTLVLLAVITPLLALFIYVGLRSGPLAPVAVTVATLESRQLAPALFGIGTVEARYTYKIGPTLAGRLGQLAVDVGDQVIAGAVLGEMEPVDLDDRVRSQESALKRAEALLREAQARLTYAQTQAHRYEQLFAVRATSADVVTAKRQELLIASAALTAAQEDIIRARSDRQALLAQRHNLRFHAPVNGVVVARTADPGTTLVAGETVIELIDPDSLWINTRFDQIGAAGLAAGLTARITLRSHSGELLPGHVLRVEPKADSVTEELLAKIVFDSLPQPLPALGELAEVTVALPSLAATPLLPNAAIRRYNGHIGVWQIVTGDLRFTPVKLGATDLNGNVQVLEGLRDGDQVVIYSAKALTAHSRINVVDHIAGISP